MPAINLPENVYITVKISGDSEIRKLNKKYLKRDCPTDVLSFNLDQETDQGYLLGEIIVNKQQALKQAGKYGNDLEHEIAALVEHGVLHLLGVHHSHDDENSVHGVSTKKATNENTNDGSKQDAREVIKDEGEGSL
ncbi:rRNA maturation RNase YbeY [Candidatus Nomurabacteria bacterium]|uniref:Endoribonuclease YbeY n=1 Tax=candidate division WWE3 bacterium TaxID=2053526 RepID=A0A955IWY0_UNCKA|nr:rRNA maturation RNase YbeY [candidate division WWE3 bacterium]MCB9823663.1 rRNA maturation RNase YbeY [Candidatus Nomurabacteria bacterium]MCB9827259.1 rRNA maturation RNase YbeY [Candidatus Nomurabacteria bacterium]MCB9827458.1 rRNA maturation RNase YbeY [Candidatus Nomurabacteria bacterium]HXK52871.1 rRNA maturation RNase YbeY [bacterium]